MKHLLLVSLTLLCSCYSGSSKKGQKDKRVVFVCKKNYMLYISMWIALLKLTPFCNNCFHCFGAGLTKDKISIDFQDIPEDSFEFFKSAFKKEIVDSPLLEFNIMTDITMNIEIIPTTEAKQPSQSTSFVLRPVSRNIPTGKNLNPDSLSMHAEYARYPLSTTEVKIAVFNHSQQKYTCGNDYSLAFYNNSNQQWEALPTSPAFEDIGWVLLPKYPPHQQTIKLYTSEVPNRPGKYRIYKTFYRDTKEVTYAEFEIFSNLK